MTLKLLVMIYLGCGLLSVILVLRMAKYGLFSTEMSSLLSLLFGPIVLIYMIFGITLSIWIAIDVWRN